MLKVFLEKIKGNSSVQEKLEVVRSPDDVAGIAKDHGREFAADKFSQLSEEELEAVAGGNEICSGFLASLCVAKDKLKHDKNYNNWPPR